MSLEYTSQTFTPGQILKAEHLNNINQGIINNMESLAGKQPKGNYLTEHQKLKTINGQSLVGDGDIKINESGGTSVQAVNYDLNVKAVNHRGYSTDAPENTIPAYIMSKERGFT